jgi:serine O-acetyltransferase
MISPLQQLKVDARLFKLKHADRNFIFALFYFPGLRVAILLRLAQWLRWKGISVLAYPLVVLNDFLHGVWVGPRAQIGAGAFWGHPRGTVINPQAKIGRFCSIAQQVDIGGPRSRVGDFVNFGAGAKVISTETRPVHVGDFVLIGAGAVITRDVPDRVVVAGVPARVIRSLTEEEIEEVWAEQLKCACVIGCERQYAPGRYKT